ncbi:MAG: hypothetical protein JNL30_05995 [Rubrivivax sp.]|nr:hypothetical protein [Rubrivivax sp.]
MPKGKRILVVARAKPAEALRVATGLTLLNDTVRVIAAAPLPDTAAVREQREMLEFVEVPCDEVGDAALLPALLAEAILAADQVYCL